LHLVGFYYHTNKEVPGGILYITKPIKWYSYEHIIYNQQEVYNVNNNNTTPGYYARKVAYTPMTDYIFQDGDFGNLATHLLSYTPKDMPSLQQSLLGKIISRAVRFSKDNVLLPLSELIKGVKTKNKIYDTGLHGAKTTIERAIKALVERGLIKYYLDTTAYPFTNRVIVYVDKIKELLGMGLNISKKQRISEAQNESEGVTQNESTNRVIDNRVIKDKDQEIPSSIEQGSVKRRAVEIAEKVKDKSRRKRKESVSTKMPFTKTNFRTVWESAEADFSQKHNIVAVGLTNKMPGMMFNAYQGKNIFIGNEWKEYIIDVVTYWNEYRHILRKFYKHNIPEYPTFNYFHKMHVKFLEVYRVNRLPNFRSIGSETSKIDRLEKEVEELRDKNRKLQSTSKTPKTYSEKAAAGWYGSPKKNKQQVKDTMWEDPADELQRGNW